MRRTRSTRVVAAVDQSEAPVVAEEDNSSVVGFAAVDQSEAPVVAEEDISSAVHEINRLARQAPLDLALGIGKIVVDRFYGGRLTAWRSRGPKDASIRELAEHPELEISASGLYRSMAVYELADRIGVSVLKQVGATRSYSVLGLPEEKQTKLLTAAASENWSTEKLEKEARKARKRRKGGRRPLPLFVKTIHQMSRFAEDGDDLFGDMESVMDMDADTVLGLYQTVTSLKLRCEELQKHLQIRIPGFSPRNEGA